MKLENVLAAAYCAFVAVKASAIALVAVAACVWSLRTLGVIGS